MQLKPPKSIRKTLAAATCALLVAPTYAADSLTEFKWQTDFAILSYAEEDRVKIIAPVLNIRRQYADESSFDAKFVFDAMTGASPNGAVPTNQVQTFTSPSGNETYTTEADRTPMRDFSDVRAAFNAQWEKPISRTLRRVYGTGLSIETDYISAGGSASFVKDINNRLTTLTSGLSLSIDRVIPTGGSPVGLSSMHNVCGDNNLGPLPQVANKENENEEDDDEGEGDDFGKAKGMGELLFGVTQVVNRRTLMQFNFSTGRSLGYLTDPYKIVSCIDPTGVQAEPGQSMDYFFEKRPNKRAVNSLFWKTVYNLNKDVIHFSYRYFWDDWGIKSSTYDVQYRFELSNKQYIAPHVRYYNQTAADFYTHSIHYLDTKPTHASADYRLGEMNSITLGLKYGYDVGRYSKMSFRFEYMVQSGDSHPSDALGVQQVQDLFPDVNAVIAQLSYQLRF